VGVVDVDVDAEQPPLTPSMNPRDGAAEAAEQDAGLLVSAILVIDDPNAKAEDNGQGSSFFSLVEASRAPEGFEAIVANKFFKHIVIGLFVILSALIILVAMLVPKENDIKENDVIQLNETQIACGTRKHRQADYRGNISITVDTNACLPWSQQDVFTSSEFPLAGLEGNSNCRNPDGSRLRPWCYIDISSSTAIDGNGSLTDATGAANRNGNDTQLQENWQYCDVPFCDGFDNDYQYDCGTLVLQQADYRGYLNTTVSGKSCQRWDEQQPHTHEYTAQHYPEGGMEDNYCR